MSAELAIRGDQHSLCWHCSREVGGEPQCPHCVKIQPLGRSSDYFSIMGLPRKLSIDPNVLEPVYHAVSRRFHPDMYRMASPRERMIALENSAVLNQAYRALRDPFERAAYLVQLEAGRAEESTDSPPDDLFEEILEVQELLAEFKFGGPEEREVLRPRVEATASTMQAAQDRLAQELTGSLFPSWDALVDSGAPDAAHKHEILLEMRRVIGERSYLRRVIQSLKSALES